MKVLGMQGSGQTLKIEMLPTPRAKDLRWGRPGRRRPGLHELYPAGVDYETLICDRQAFV